MKFYQDWKARRASEWERVQDEREFTDLTLRLEELFQKAKKRKSHDRFNEWSDFRDFLDNKEKYEYSTKAERHFYLTQKLGKGDPFKFFNKTFDVGKADPKPPKAYISVSNKKNVEITLEYSEDRTRVRELRDGVPYVSQYNSDPEGWMDATKHFVNPDRAKLEELTGKSYGELWEEWKKDHPYDEWWEEWVKDHPHDKWVKELRNRLADPKS